MVALVYVVGWHGGSGNGRQWVMDLANCHMCIIHLPPSPSALSTRMAISISGQSGSSLGANISTTTSIFGMLSFTLIQSFITSPQSSPAIGDGWGPPVRSGWVPTPDYGPSRLLLVSSFHLLGKVSICCRILVTFFSEQWPITSLVIGVSYVKCPSWHTATS